MADLNDLLSNAIAGQDQQTIGSVQPPADFGVEATGTPAIDATGIPVLGAQQQQQTYVRALQGKQDEGMQSIQQLQNSLRNLKTPEERTKELFDAAMGVKHLPTFNPDGSAGKPKTKVNWLQALGTIVSETSQRFNQKDTYVPLMERLRGQAGKQYEEESGPLARQLDYMMAYQRNLDNTVQKGIGTEQAQANKAVTNQVLLNNSKLREQYQKVMMQVDQKKMQEIDGKIALMASQGKVADAKALLDEEQKNLTKTRTEFMRKNQGLQGNPALAAKAAANPNDPVAQKAFQNALQMAEAARLSYGQPQDLGNGPMQYPNKPGFPAIPAGGGTQQSTPQSTPQGNGNPMIPSKTPVGPMPQGQTQGVFKGTSPTDKYGVFAGNGDPLTVKLKGTPQGATPQNDATLFVPREKLDDRQKSSVDSAMNLYQYDRPAMERIAAIDPKYFEPVRGNVAKFILGKVPTDPNLRYLYNELHALAVAHIGAQNMRSAQAAEMIQKDLFNLGGGKNEVMQAIKAYIDQSEKVFRSHPSSKARVATLPFMDYPEMQRLYVPEDWNANMVEKVKAEQQRRTLQKNLQPKK